MDGIGTNVHNMIMTFSSCRVILFGRWRAFRSLTMCIFVKRYVDY